MAVPLHAVMRSSCSLVLALEASDVAFDFLGMTILLYVPSLQQAPDHDEGVDEQDTVLGEKPISSHPTKVTDGSAKGVVCKRYGDPVAFHTCWPGILRPALTQIKIPARFLALS
jgi:hypothetical protein